MLSLSPSSSQQLIQNYNPDQAGGHIDRFSFHGQRVVKSGKKAEAEFYQWMQKQETPLFSEFRSIATQFYGVEVKAGGQVAVVLENLLSGYGDHPDLLDCKLGKITWTREHDLDGISRRTEKNKHTTTSTLGFRICGILRKNHQGEILQQLTKKQADVEVTSDNIIHYFKRFVSNEDGQLQKEILQNFIQDLEKIKDWFCKNREQHFRKSSLLFVKGKNGKCQVRLIDFSCVEPANGETDGIVLEALEKLLEI